MRSSRAQDQREWEFGLKVRLVSAEVRTCANSASGAFAEVLGAVFVAAPVLGRPPREDGDGARSSFRTRRFLRPPRRG